MQKYYSFLHFFRKKDMKSKKNVLSLQPLISFMNNGCILYRYFSIVICVSSLLLFFFACWIYISFRSADMALYSWLHIDYGTPLFNWLRVEDINLPNWMVYNAPDGMWLFSYLLFIESIWDNSSIKWLFVWGMVLFSYALEILQFANIFPGTGDILDIFFFSSAILLYLSIHKLKLIFNEKFH